jgi:hypothetical protein
VCRLSDGEQKRPFAIAYYSKILTIMNPFVVLNIALTIRAFARLGGAKTMSANCFLNVYTYKCSPFGQFLTKLSANFCTRYL